ncbi:cartilage intermediate layer protein 2-like [Xiphophorus maculatus]|uniref:cartilage intermediate layer protein 2-like n=1 Tax=Xiphophorus maculatus TaxID=8083 RepID=UPI000C6E1790|nr:cartilage intermediate layer protein 2-like [Xiphophorus maculatus]
MAYEGWTEWFDRDNPSGSGDWETLSSLRRENPGKICPNPKSIEARTLSGRNAEDTGEKIYKYDTTSGFVCRMKDQRDRKCHDYKVRFSCSFDTCENVCWTKWYNRDHPSGSGDWEHLSALRKEKHGGDLCADPVYVEAVTVEDEIPALKTGQKFHYYSPGKGFVCRNKDQRFDKCRNYKVCFGCSCRSVA